MNTKLFDMKEMETDTGGGLEFLTVGEAAQLVHVSKSTMRNWINNGLLRCMRHGRGAYEFSKMTYYRSFWGIIMKAGWLNANVEP